MSLLWSTVRCSGLLLGGYARTATPSAQFSQNPQFPYIAIHGLISQSALEI